MGGFVITPRQKQLVNKVLDTTRLSYGPMTEKFEKMWSTLHDVKYSLFCNSGTSALQVALHALKEKYGWEDGTEAIIPATTFVATMNIVLHNNMQPVFVDIEPDYYNIDPEKIEAAITPLTKVIIVVHLLGQAAQMDKIMRIARKHKLKVIEDSCETVGTTYAGKPVGSWGDISCFSTYASHLVVTGVGGFACTNDADLATRIKGLYNHGRDGIYHSIDDNKKGTQIIKSRFNFVHPGYSYRCTEMESALGIGHMERFPRELKIRQKNAQYLIQKLQPLEDAGFITLPKVHPKNTHSWMLFAIGVKDPAVLRDQVIDRLERKGIATRFVMPLLTQPYIKKMYGNDIIDSFPVSKEVNRKHFLLGMHAELTKEDLDYVVKEMYKIFDYE